MVEPPNRTFILGTTIGGGIVLASVAVALILRFPADPPAPPPAPKVMIMPAAPSVVPIHIEAPTPPEPPPSEAFTTVHASVPFLQARCLNPADPPTSGLDSCAWEDGFPAISRDGKTVVVKHIDEDGGRGNPNLRVEFFDVATNKRLRSVTILTGDEYDPETWDALQKIVEPRVAKLNAQLDGYRALEPIGNNDEELEHPTTLRFEQRESKLQIIDPQTRRAIFHRNFDAAVVYPNHKSDPDRECSGLSQLGDIPSWWDADTKTIVVSVTYASGGCICGEQTDTFVKRL